MTILLSYERYMAVCKGKKLESKKILTYISIVCISAVIYGSPTLWMYKWDYSQNGEIISKWTKLACNKTFLIIYLVFLNIIIRLILPIVCLIVFNILIFKQVSNFTFIFKGYIRKLVYSDVTLTLNDDRALVDTAEF